MPAAMKSEPTEKKTAETEADHPEIAASIGNMRPGLPTPKITGQQLLNVGIVSMSLAIGVISWHFVTAMGFDFYMNFQNVPPPAKVLAAFVAHVQTEVFWTHVAVSMRRILISYCLAVVLGISTGLVMGRSRDGASVHHAVH